MNIREKAEQLGYVVEEWQTTTWRDRHTTWFILRRPGHPKAEAFRGSIGAGGRWTLHLPNSYTHHNGWYGKTEEGGTYRGAVRALEERRHAHLDKPQYLGERG